MPTFRSLDTSYTTSCHLASDTVLGGRDGSGYHSRRKTRLVHNLKKTWNILYKSLNMFSLFIDITLAKHQNRMTQPYGNASKRYRWYCKLSPIGLLISICGLPRSNTDPEKNFRGGGGGGNPLNPVSPPLDPRMKVEKLNDPRNTTNPRQATCLHPGSNLVPQSQERVLLILLMHPKSIAS